MKHLSISRKFSAVFAVAIASLIGLGIFAVLTIAQLETSLVDIGIGQRDALVALANVNTSTSNFRIYQADGIRASTPHDRMKAKTDMDGQTKIINDSIAYLESHLPPSRGLTALQQATVSWNRFMQHVPKTTALSDANKDSEANASLSSEYKDFNEANDAFSASQDAVVLEMTRSTSASIATADHWRILMMVMIAAVVALLIALLVLLVRSIAKPIVTVTDAITELAHGQLDVAMPIEDRRDEIGKLGTAMVGLRDQLKAEAAKNVQMHLAVESIGDGLAALAQRDLTCRVEADLTGPFAKLKTNFNDAAGELQSAMQSVAQGASGISTEAGEIRQASDDLSQRTEQQAASLEETAAAMDELTASVRKTAEGTDRANALVGGVRGDAETSGEVVRRAVEAMGGIERSSSEISEIISVIDGIAFQTNLLALNAGVEAARAGDAGRGFAVVASEVRALAQRSADAAKDVKAKINASSDQVDTGVGLVAETGKSLERIIAQIGEVSRLVSDIAGSAQQQASGLQQVNTAVSEMDSVTQQNAAMVEEATAAARSLASEADGLARQVGRFNLGDDMAAPAASPVDTLGKRVESGARKIAPITRPASQHRAA